MFFDDKSKQMTMIMSKRNHMGEKTMSATPMKPEVVKTEEGELDGKHLAAQDIIAAHHEKSPERLMEALSNFINIHHSKESE